jgi:hypothetical protein
MANRNAPLVVEVSAGELIDKITILEIKLERMTDAAKLQNVRRELEALAAVRAQALDNSEPLTRLTEQLKAVNGTLWEIEDAIRACERNREFGPRFVELARSVYRENDRRSALKQTINRLLESRLVEEKSYEPYAEGS